MIQKDIFLIHKYGRKQQAAKGLLTFGKILVKNQVWVSVHLCIANAILHST